MAGVSDPYRLLGVPHSASLSQIKAAHRALAKRFHPDSPTADAQRFLRVQEAYQLLADPLRRREWDARHSPAPMRADEPAAARPRGRGRQPAATGREQASRSYTWSASEVPWWEESVRDGRDGARSRRSAGGRGRARPREEAGAQAEQQQPEAAEAPPAGETQAEPARPDFDVYNRSSGAAWSAAARAYFRRADQDLPRRGSFRHRGGQPLTAARARVAAEEEARRERAGRAAPPGGGQPAYAWAGVARDAESIGEVRAARRRRELAARWPSRLQRIRYAALGWLPLALLIAYGGPVAVGCQPGVDCPPQLPALSAVLALFALAALLLLPKIAYATTLATSGLAVVAGAGLLGAWLMGIRAPQLSALPPSALAVGAGLLAVAYLLSAAWLLVDPRHRPWSAEWDRLR